MKRLRVLMALLFHVSFLPALPGWAAPPVVLDLIVKGTPYVDVRSNMSTLTYLAWLIAPSLTDVSSAVITSLADGNKTILFPTNKTYKLGGSAGLYEVFDNTIIQLGNATIQLASDNATHGHGFRVFGTKNITISGGTIIGDRATRSSGVGMNIQVTGGFSTGADNILIENVKSRDAYLDNFNVGGGATTSNRVRIINSDGWNARRCALSITGKVGSVRVDGFRGSGTNGSSPEAGLDVEPDAGESTEIIDIANSDFYLNTGPGVYVQKGNGISTKRVRLSNVNSYLNSSYGFNFSGALYGSGSNLNGWENAVGGMVFTDASNWDVNGGVLDNNANNNLEINSSHYLYLGGGMQLVNSQGDGAVVRVNSSNITMDVKIKGSANHGLNLNGVYNSNISADVSESQLSGVYAAALDNSTLRLGSIINNNQATGANFGALLGAVKYSRIYGGLFKGAHQYHLIETSSSVGNTIEMNDVSDNAAIAGKINIGGTDTTVRGNKRGTGASNGRATLASGTVTVSTNEVVTGDSISLTRVVGGGTGRGMLEVGTIVNETSFVINSTDAAGTVVTTDNSVVYWEIRH
jgi:hypothetical protein